MSPRNILARYKDQDPHHLQQLLEGMSTQAEHRSACITSILISLFTSTGGTTSVSHTSVCSKGAVAPRCRCTASYRGSKPSTCCRETKTERSFHTYTRSLTLSQVPSLYRGAYTPCWLATQRIAVSMSRAVQPETQSQP
jgi:hypothetical protein